MPTSKNLAGMSFWRMSSPVPSGMAAVIPTIFSFFEAISTIAFPKTVVYEGAVSGFFGDIPVILSNGVTPWSAWTSFSAGSYPFPFLVIVWMRIGPEKSLTSVKILTSCDDVVPVDRTEVPEPERFEEHPRSDDHLDAFLDARGDLPDPVPHHVEFARSRS